MSTRHEELLPRASLGCVRKDYNRSMKLHKVARAAVVVVITASAGPLLLASSARQAEAVGTLLIAAVSLSWPLFLFLCGRAYKKALTISLVLVAISLIFEIVALNTPPPVPLRSSHESSRSQDGDKQSDATWIIADAGR